MVRVVIVSGAALFRQGLRNILSQSSGVAIVAEAGDLRDGMECMSALHPDVVVLERDGEMGVGAIDAVFAQNGISRLIVVSLRDNRLTVYNRDAVPNPNPRQLLTAVLTGVTR